MTKEFNWSTAPTICEVNGVRWVLGPQTEDKMSWYGTADWCESVGGVLPPREILLLAYLNKEIEGSFAFDYYWSSSEVFSSNAWAHDFYDGNQYNGDKLSSFLVRAVRSFKLNEAVA